MIRSRFPLLLCLILLAACQSAAVVDDNQATTAQAPPFAHDRGTFADVQVLAYEVPGFAGLSLQQKTLIYYLSQATYAGRDIMYDQNYRHNLRIKRTLEAIWQHYSGDRSTADFAALQTFTRLMWFSNGIHHDTSTLKLRPAFTAQSFAEYVHNVAQSNTLPLLKDESTEELLLELTPILFDATIDAKKVETAAGMDKVANSAVNFYEGVTEREVRNYYLAKANPKDLTPVSHGLNSKLVKNAQGEISERIWKIDGMYTQALEQVVYWLEKAIGFAQNSKQKRALQLLVEYYYSGDLKVFDEYSIAWVEDTESEIDLISGFIEVYNDPIAFRGAFESVVSFRDEATTQRIAAIGNQAQWFEDHMPIMPQHRREKVQGIAGRAITVVAESGDASPTTATGINLPNSSWIRANHGSKSVTITNVFAAHNALGDKAITEFAWDDNEVQRAVLYGELASALFIDMHEVIGHASGRTNPGVGTTKETLKQYASTSEEGRADLVALHYIMDKKLIELGLMPSLQVGQAAYDRYIRRGMLSQYDVVALGERIEEAHMRNRAMIARWAYAKGLPDNVIEQRERNGKTYFVINDYDALRGLFAQLLKELQRIKSEGDFAAIAHLVETYGTQVDPQLHREIIARFEKLDLQRHRAFINPVLTPVYKGERIADVLLSYPASFDEQMLHYAQHYSFLPHMN